VKKQKNLFVFFVLLISFLFSFSENNVYADEVDSNSQNISFTLTTKNNSNSLSDFNNQDISKYLSGLLPQTSNEKMKVLLIVIFIFILIIFMLINMKRRNKNEK